MLRPTPPQVFIELEKGFRVFPYTVYHVMLLFRISKIQRSRTGFFGVTVSRDFHAYGRSLFFHYLLLKKMLQIKLSVTIKVT